MKNILKAFRFYKNQGDALQKSVISSIEIGSEKQIQYANDIIISILAETQGTLNNLFIIYKIDDENRLEECFNDHEEYPFKGYNIMINTLLLMKNAKNVIDMRRDIKGVLDVNKKIETYLEDNNISC